MWLRQCNHFQPSKCYLTESIWEATLSVTKGCKKTVSIKSLEAKRLEYCGQFSFLKLWEEMALKRCCYRAAKGWALDLWAWILYHCVAWLKHLFLLELTQASLSLQYNLINFTNLYCTFFFIHVLFTICCFHLFYFIFLLCIFINALIKYEI